MAQTVTFTDGTTLPVLAVYGQRELIQGAYREAYEIRFSPEDTTYAALSEIAAPENLSVLILTERNEAGEITARFTHLHFSIVTGLGEKTAPEDGARYFFLSVAQKSDAELALEQLARDNEDIQAALIELAEIVAAAETEG